MEHAPYTIRPLNETDHQEFERFQQLTRPIFDTWIGEAAADVRVTLIAEVDGRFVGVVSAHAYRSELDGGGFRFDRSAAVIEDISGDRSVQAELLSRAETEIRGKGFRQLMMRASKRAAPELAEAGWTVGRSGFGFVWNEGFGGCRFTFDNGSGADSVAVKIFKPDDLVGAWYREPSDHRDFMKRVGNSDRAMREAHPR